MTRDQIALWEQTYVGSVTGLRMSRSGDSTEAIASTAEADAYAAVKVRRKMHPLTIGAALDAALDNSQVVIRAEKSDYEGGDPGVWFLRYDRIHGGCWVSYKEGAHTVTRSFGNFPIHGRGKLTFEIQDLYDQVHPSDFKNRMW